MEEYEIKLVDLSRCGIIPTVTCFTPPRLAREASKSSSLVVGSFGECQSQSGVHAILKVELEIMSCISAVCHLPT